ncbi:MAG: prepilin-type N-terminal cleavage/methylation domain-containing protein [Bacillati bacterium ANGP1]|uniref:Prepilin-type N-terminal cleavage/methylation domain-containing protein n=1 Tax=Candidatus Segetimicrobium genomatis TaxID=2569760 RepID=A0A537LAE7_9BACT|nr:MAG: prepilin-type N-terminal cleavage/methylation domain-containing protein [Terrabacteria group bacterium ANGP1]
MTILGGKVHTHVRYRWGRAGFTLIELLIGRSWPPSSSPTFCGPAPPASWPHASSTCATSRPRLSCSMDRIRHILWP